MTEQNTLHTDATVQDYFLIEGHLLSTRTADCYKALDRSRNVPVCLWMLRHPLAQQSEAVKRFLSRMKAISEISPNVSEMSAYGVDAGGVAFSVFPSLDGFPSLHGNYDMAEAERRFTTALRYVERLHQHGLACGDLCGSSFWVNREGDLRFIGVMGSFDAEAIATTVLPPVDTIPFYAPEQRSGSGIDKATDVFALGVLGYALLCRRFPYGEGQGLLVGKLELEKVTLPTKLIANPPSWADEVLMRCLRPSPQERFTNVTEVIKEITAVRQRVFNDSSMPVSKKQLAHAPENSALTVKPLAIESQEQEISEPQAPKRMLRLVGLSIVASAAIFALLFSQRLGRSRPEEGADKEDLRSHASALGNEELKLAAERLASEEGSQNVEEKAAEIEKIASSDDPLAHEILVKSAKEAGTAKVRELSEKAIVERARRLGLLRSAEQVRQWLRGINRNQLPSAYEAVLKSLDTTSPIEARSSALRQAYASEPVLVLRLATSLAIDSDKIDQYQPVISQIIGDNLKLEDATRHSALALILASPELSTIFGEDVIQKRNDLPDGDVLWLLRILAERNDINVRSLASLAVERGLLSPVKAKFLQLVRDRSDLPPDILRSLLRAAAGALTASDVASFGRWYDIDAEKILMAVLADSDDTQVLQDAFDTLAGKTINNKACSELVQWVRKHYAEKRGEFGKLIGIMGNLDSVDAKMVDSTFKNLDNYVRDADLIEILLGSDNAVVVRIVLDKYADLVNLGGLLRLLSNPDKQIRILAVKGLKSYNDIGALKIIIDHYEKENDEEVRQVYKENFWMIKQREE